MRLLLVLLLLGLLLGGCASQNSFFINLGPMPGNRTMVNANTCELQGNATTCGPHINVVGYSE